MLLDMWFITPVFSEISLSYPPENKSTPNVISDAKEIEKGFGKIVVLCIGDDHSVFHE
jgi:hypothetical protein